jgi:hypothetical protein
MKKRLEVSSIMGGHMRHGVVMKGKLFQFNIETDFFPKGIN